MAQELKKIIFVREGGPHDVVSCDDLASGLLYYMEECLDERHDPIMMVLPNLGIKFRFDKDGLWAFLREELTHEEFVAKYHCDAMARNIVKVYGIDPGALWCVFEDCATLVDADVHLESRFSEKNFKLVAT